MEMLLVPHMLPAMFHSLQGEMGQMGLHRCRVCSGQEDCCCHLRHTRWPWPC